MSRLKTAKRKPGELYCCPYCGEGYPHDLARKHWEKECAKKPKGVRNG